MDFDRTASYDDRIERCIWKFTWKNGTGQGICRRSVSGLCTDRTTVVFLFSSSTNSAMKSIRANSAMIKKVYVPKYMYPLSGILSNFVIFLISLVVLVGVMLFFLATGSYKAPMNANMFLTVIPLLNLLILSIGVGLILATLCVFFRDIEYLWSVMLMLIMYCSAIFYFASRLKGAGGMLIKINPLYGIIDNFRRALFGQHFDMVLLGYTFGVSIVAFLLGMFMFYKKQDTFILNI